MIFLALIIGLFLWHIWGADNPLQRDDWFETWQARVNTLAVLPAFKLALSVLLPAVVAYLVLQALDPLLFGVFWIAAAVVLLLYSFGRGDIQAQLQRYQIQCRNGDFEAAYLAITSEQGWADAADEVPNSAAVHALVQRGFLYEGYQRWFAVLFYFLLLGPVGALAYRLLQLACKGEGAALARYCLNIVDWVPARLLATAFTLTGDFVHSCDELWLTVNEAGMKPRKALYIVAEAAAGDSVAAPDVNDSYAFGGWAAQQSEEFSGLLRRSAMTWIVIVSLSVVMI